jgi:chorismate mutase
MADPNDPGDWRVDRVKASALARIAALRDEIDRIDGELVILLNRRAAQALEIGQIKKTLQMEIYQPSREEAVLRHVREANPGPLDADAIARLFERIIDEARRLERVTGERAEAASHEPATPDLTPEPKSLKPEV